MKKWIYILFFCLIFSYAKAEKVYDFNATCQQAYKEITSLKIANGQRLINAARQQNPNNLIPDLLEGYVDFFVLFFNEDPAEYKIRKEHFEDRIDRLDDGPDNSPYYRYCLSVAYLQKATVAIKFGERIGAAWNFRKAFGLIKENRKKFPSFLPNNMIYGPMEVMIGVVPDNYKWMASLLGMKGSVKDGMQLMENFVNSKDSVAKFFFNEATFYYCYLTFYIENDPDAVFQFIREKNLDLVNNHLFAYLAANIALNDKQTEYAKSIIQNRNMSPEYLKTSVWDFEMAYIKLHHLELPEATTYFNTFLRNFKGKFYVKDSYQKLSWCYYLQNNLKAAEGAKQLLLRRGSTDTDADKQAEREAKKDGWPNAVLLKARLLNDGGYNKEALAMLQNADINSFTKPEERLEYHYRLARIYDDIGRDDEAIKAYNNAIDAGQNSTEYYASRAALQIGYIYEKRGNKSMAIAYYQKCLNMGDHDYKDSIDQKAKAGIARCKGE